MKLFYYPVIAALFCAFAKDSSVIKYEFEPAQKIQAGGQDISVEKPGYAAPCLADIDGDGINDLLVGQFKGGKIAFYKGSKNGKQMTFAKKQWQMIGEKVAAVPGVW